ncbi:hypothetical protein [Halosimplex sp. TS25]|uniref:hypothetical protein n=1 Tax=Halosimplex rarum TaxID=3396619 RepID=UPI0039ED772A
MPGYIRGVVEQKFGDSWELVSRVEPITGSQGTFKYVMLTTKWASYLDPLPGTEGLPEDLSVGAKLSMLGFASRSLDRFSNADLDAAFDTLTGDMKHEQHVSLDELTAFDWGQGISRPAWERMREEYAESKPYPHEYRPLRLFELVDADGTPYEQWESDDARDCWRTRVTRQELVGPLLHREWIEIDGRQAHLRERTRKEMLPIHWFRLLATLDDASRHRDVRFTFYWVH